MSASSVFETATQFSDQDLGAFLPRIPQHVEETGISQNTLVNLMLKLVMLEGESSLAGVAKRLRIHPAVANQIFNHLRKE